MIEQPAFANCHSHAFHRALRGRVDGADSFWAWRDHMYALAGVLDPDLMFDLASATYGEMRCAGIGVVGEFHYVHHSPDGTPYDDPNAMGEAMIAAAKAAGIRICLLDACYLGAGFGREPEGVQQRFSDGTVDAWRSRVETLAGRYRDDADVVIGAAIHSVRAVPREDLEVVSSALPEAPLHVHVSEQPAENQECLAATGFTPTALLDQSGVWTERTTAVHATHLTSDDIRTLGDSKAFFCFCPTTERELADGIGPSVRLRESGARLTLGSDSNTVVDMFEEARSVEMNERLASGVRGSWSAGQLLNAATIIGYQSLGFEAVDTIDVSTDSVRMAGVTQPLWAASAADVLELKLDPRPLGRDVPSGNAGPSGAAHGPEDVAEQLRVAIETCWSRL